ncbi:TPA: hemin uptake protein HemP [Morganella morganii]|uniref:hemin uptake protein HemP n=1 Tax=Morganella morganii TaxID=582 RepID=UPI000D59D939|nr:hemin uptake protein HemP [Morganella morganii]MBT0374299.1 hemin uptake protein HemP [Morganella morganii subsp. morganii]EKW5729560.1 hemin uptake protein HemP [Morganella morganii]ELA8728975.1 hemin uptake protein HemP [Morganella morganii]ELB1849288.1 hemin uptake protein HemP [Morganella morganii]
MNKIIRKNNRIKYIPYISTTINDCLLIQVIICHQNEEYHLRRTKNGKLILTK